MSRLLSKLLNKNFHLDKDLAWSTGFTVCGRFHSDIAAKLQKMGSYEN